MFSKRLLAASLEPLMLSLLADGPKYGYEIIRRARHVSGGQIQWSNSKLYPLLHRLECEALVEAFWRPSESGPDRKYYRLTPKGHEALAATQAEWRSMYDLFAQLWGPGWSPALGRV
ncbi:MAG: PadR family transcriptional regulator [Bacteroidota bacterium]